MPAAPSLATKSLSSCFHERLPRPGVGKLISNGALATGHSDALGFGPVTNNARFALEANLRLFGTYLQGAGGRLDTAFAGPECLPASMSVAQAVTLAGTLSLRLPGCTPTAGQTFLLLSSGVNVMGTFAACQMGLCSRRAANCFASTTPPHR